MEPFTPFTFNTVPRLICEVGSTKKLGALIAEHFDRISRALIVTDPGFLKTGLVDPAIASLRAADIQVSIYSDVQADPPEAVVQQAATAAACSAKNIELVIGFGGGSSMDVAKLISVLLGNDQELKEMYGIGNVKGKRLPLVQIPTTAGTGSEVTPISIVTTGATTKMGVVAPQLYADLAILDAELTVGLPKNVTAATGIDAMVHAIEAYTSQTEKESLVGYVGMGFTPVVGKPGHSLRRWTKPCRSPSDADGCNAWPVSHLPMRQSPRYTPSPTRSAEFSMSRMACQTRWSCRMCCASTCTERRTALCLTGGAGPPRRAGFGRSLQPGIDP